MNPVTGATDDDDATPRETGVASLLTHAARATSAMGSLMIVGLMLAINLDVGGRYLFNHPIPGTAEVIAASIVSIIFLQLPDCIRTGRMIRSDVIIGRLHARGSKVATVLEALFTVLSLVMLGTLVRYIAPVFADAWTAHRTIGVPGIFVAPIWPFYGLVMVGASLATLEYLRQSIALLRRIVAVGAQP